MWAFNDPVPTQLIDLQVQFTGSVDINWGDNTDEPLFTGTPTDHFYGGPSSDYLTYEDGTPKLDEFGQYIFLV